MTIVGKIKQRGKEMCITAKNRILDLVYPPIKGLRDTMRIFKAYNQDVYMAVLSVAQVLVIMQIGSSVRQANVCVCAFVYCNNGRRIESNLRQINHSAMCLSTNGSWRNAQGSRPMAKGARPAADLSINRLFVDYE